MKRVAVIIPTYKPKEYLKKCLDSLEKQSLTKDRFCVYIALNGDKQPYENNILTLLTNYNFNYQYIYIKESGVSNARNELIDCSKEEFLAFIDDDDLISPHYLSHLLEVSTQEYVGIAKVYHFKKNINVLTSISISKLYGKLPLLEKSKIKAWRYHSQVWAKLIHRDIIEDIRFNKKMEIAEDTLFFIAISKNIKGFCKPKKSVYYYYLDREGSVSRKNRPLKYRIKSDIFFISRCVKLLALPKYDRLFILTMIVFMLRYFLWLIFKDILIFLKSFFCINKGN